MLLFYHLHAQALICSRILKKEAISLQNMSGVCALNKSIKFAGIAGWYPGFDRYLVFSAISLLLLGWVMVASSSIVVAEQRMGDPFYYAFRHGIYMLIGLFMAYVTVRIPIYVWRKCATPFLFLVLSLLCAVLIPGIGREVNGSTRWISLGVITLQASELAKLGIFVYLSSYIVRYKEAIQTDFSAFIKPLLLLSVISLLLLLEPDFGAAVVIFGTSMGMLFLAGVRIRQFMLLSLVLGITFSGLAVSSPYRLERLTSFLNPWADQFNSGYQLTQALIAFGRGEWLGVGLGNSIQKMFYLPEAHTDFLFAVIAEELGLVGILGVLALFVLLLMRGFYIGRRAILLNEPFAGFLAYGLSIWIGLQALINIGVNSGMLPTKGLTLPMMSYGGSSIIVICIVIGLLLRIDHEMRLRMHKRKGYIS